MSPALAGGLLAADSPGKSQPSVLYLVYLLIYINKRVVFVEWLSCVQLFCDPMAPLSMGFPRQEG